MTRRIARRLAAGLATLAAGHLVASAAEAQVADSTAGPVASAVPTAADSLDVGAAPLRWIPVGDSLHAILRALQLRGDLGPITTLDSVVRGPARVPAGDTVHRSIIVYGGSLELGGHVDGSVAVVGGDLLVGDGASVAGSATAAGGTVRVTGGSVAGDIRSSPGATGLATPDAVLDPRSIEVVNGDAPAAATWRAVKLVVACFALFTLLGVGILLFSHSTFEAVLDALEQRFTRAFWTGLLAQFAILPVLLVLVIVLAVSLVGILLIPFAMVAYVVAVAGLVALGFLAAARLTGAAFAGRAASPSRSADLRGLLIGLAVYFGLWLLAAGATWHPLAGTALRAVAVAVTWVAVTVGLGAIIAAVLAARRDRASVLAPREPEDAMAWQTPTPITGVVAAHRPLSPSREG